MFKIIVFLVFCVAVCYCQNPAPRVYCGETPNNVSLDWQPPGVFTMNNAKTVTCISKATSYTFGQHDVYGIYRILRCLKNPHVLSPDVISGCRTSSSQSQCDIMNCAFRESSWLKSGAVDKPKIIAHFNQLGKDKPEWKKALEHAVPNCLERDLLPQGVFVNCPAYDIIHCVLISFIQQSESTQWATTSDCAYPRQYAGACAVCPSECFSPAVPAGSCNACYGVPKPAA